MTRFETDIDWLDAAIPEGLPVPSAAVISGPGEAGKPLLALGVVSSWLRAGGSVIAAPLQFPDPAFIAESAADLYQLLRIRLLYSVWTAVACRLTANQLVTAE